MQTAANQTFTPLAQETRTAIPTADAAFHLGRKSQTLRAWACLENGPIRPIRIFKRLAWKVSEIRALLEGGAIMENARPQTSETSAPDKRNYTPGTLPKRINTVIAAVLAGLLESNTLTGMESVFKQSTTRLGAAIYRLEHDYGWRIDRRDIATGTNDGRIATISAYWLPQATIAQAFDAGAREWIDKVKAARAERRKQSDKCKSDAARINAARKCFKTHDPRQGDLWGCA